MDKQVVRDIALLIFRVVLGVIFVAHGANKFFSAGMDATIPHFVEWGIPLPVVFAWVTVILEMVGGALLVVGLLSTAMAGALALLMCGAVYYVHLPHGLFNSHGGFEYPLVLVFSLLMIVVFGAGRASLDELLRRVGS